MQGFLVVEFYKYDTCTLYCFVMENFRHNLGVYTTTVLLRKIKSLIIIVDMINNKHMNTTKQKISCSITRITILIPSVYRGSSECS